jgi:flagellar M-ring protein FliF
MPPKAKDAFSKVTTTFARFTPGQKAVVILAIAGLLFGGMFFSKWASKPSYAPLYTNLSSEDASAVVDQLNTSKTPYKLEDAGSTITVPKDSVYNLRLTMSGKGIPSGDSEGYKLLDKEGVTASQFQQQVTYQRALKGELEKTIEAIDSVDTAVVNLAIPQKDVFAKDSDAPTASVLIATKPGVDLSNQQVTSIVNLVSSSVDGLKASNVTVTDSKGQTLASGGTTSAGAGTARDDQTVAFEARMQSSLQDMLDKVVGTGHAVVTVNADLDYDQTTTHSETYTSDPNNPPLADHTKTETYSGNGDGSSTATGVLGPDNIQVPTGTASSTGATGTSSSAGAYTTSDRTVNNTLNKVVEDRLAAPGAIQKLSAAVLLDTKTAGSIDPAQVQSLVATALGTDAQRGDVVTVERMAFNDTAAKDAAKALAAARAGDASAAKAKTMKSAAITLGVVLLLLFFWISGKRRKKKIAQNGGGLSPEERMQVEQLKRELEQYELESAQRAELEALRAGQLESGQRKSGPDPRDVHIETARAEIAEMVESQPEQVAMLLRGWLADRRA